ncbi:hypothetical protein I7I48_00483 [Histoplasma ohiense]|nr:hypothetical protein I7I48_00483 [Histoplasma ohiense (nom. inval.)]
MTVRIIYLSGMDKKMFCPFNIMLALCFLSFVSRPLPNAVLKTDRMTSSGKNRYHSSDRNTRNPLFRQEYNLNINTAKLTIRTLKAVSEPCQPNTYLFRHWKVSEARNICLTRDWAGPRFFQVAT